MVRERGHAGKSSERPRVPLELVDAGEEPQSPKSIFEKLLDRTAEQTELLRGVLKELQRQSFATPRIVEPRWLTVTEAARYCGMSEKWVRSLESTAPRGLFRRVKGTVFLDRQKLDLLFEGKLELSDY